MAKSTTPYWNPLTWESQGRWTPVSGLEGMAEELTLSMDPATGEYTRLTRFQPGADTTPFGGKSHDYPEEVFIVSGRLYDHAFDLWLEAGHYASRPAGEMHGPFKTEVGCVVLELSFPMRGPVSARVGRQSEVSTTMNHLHIERHGEGPRVLFVHGSVSGGAATWKAQYPLAERWALLVMDRRGFGESPPADGDDFEVDARDIAEALGGGAHLVAHSYGGVGALLAAAARPEAVQSLTLVEPTAYSVALDREHVRRAVDQTAAHFTGNSSGTRDFLGGFFQLMGVQAKLPDPLPPALETATRVLMRCRFPWTAEFPLDDLARAPFRSLIVSGQHSPVFESICDVLAARLGAERAVIPGAGHSVPRAGTPFNDKLEAFLLSSAGRRPTIRCT